MGDAPATRSSESMSSSLPGAPISSEKQKDGWDKVDIIGKLLGAILIPLAVALTGFLVNIALQNRQIEEKKFEIAITVLESKGTAPSDLANWAENVVKADLSLSSAEAAQLRKSFADGAPCGAYPNMFMENGVCKFGSKP